MDFYYDWICVLYGYILFGVMAIFFFFFFLFNIILQNLKLKRKAAKE